MEKIHLFLTVIGWHLGYKLFHIFLSGFSFYNRLRLHFQKPFSDLLPVSAGHCSIWVFSLDLWHNRSNTLFGLELGLKPFCSKSRPSTVWVFYPDLWFRDDTEWYIALWFHLPLTVVTPGITQSDTLFIHCLHCKKCDRTHVWVPLTGCMSLWRLIFENFKTTLIFFLTSCGPAAPLLTTRMIFYPWVRPLSL